MFDFWLKKFGYWGVKLRMYLIDSLLIKVLLVVFFLLLRYKKGKIVVIGVFWGCFGYELYVVGDGGKFFIW